MNITSRAECIELEQDGSLAVIVAEGLRSWSSSSGRILISRGPRLKAAAPALGRLRTVPDRIGIVSGTAETHAVILARNCRAEEMELTQRWSFDGNGFLTAALEFIVPPACAAAGMEKLGVEIDFPGETAGFDMKIENGILTSLNGIDGGILEICLPGEHVRAGIHRINITFMAEIQEN